MKHKTRKQFFLNEPYLAHSKKLNRDKTFRGRFVSIRDLPHTFGDFIVINCWKNSKNKRR